MIDFYRDIRNSGIVFDKTYNLYDLFLNYPDENEESNYWESTDETVYTDAYKHLIEQLNERATKDEVLLHRYIEVVYTEKTANDETTPTDNRVSPKDAFLIRNFNFLVFRKIYSSEMGAFIYELCGDLGPGFKNASSVFDSTCLDANTTKTTDTAIKARLQSAADNTSQFFTIVWDDNIATENNRADSPRASIKFNFTVLQDIIDFIWNRIYGEGNPNEENQRNTDFKIKDNSLLSMYKDENDKLNNIRACLDALDGLIGKIKQTNDGSQISDDDEDILYYQSDIHTLFTKHNNNIYELKLTETEDSGLLSDLIQALMRIIHNNQDLDIVQIVKEIREIKNIAEAIKQQIVVDDTYLTATVELQELTNLMDASIVVRNSFQDPTDSHTYEQIHHFNMKPIDSNEHIFSFDQRTLSINEEELFGWTMRSLNNINQSPLVDDLTGYFDPNKRILSEFFSYNNQDYFFSIFNPFWLSLDEQPNKILYAGNPDTLNDYFDSSNPKPVGIIKIKVLFKEDSTCNAIPNILIVDREQIVSLQDPVTRKINLNKIASLNNLVTPIVLSQKQTSNGIEKELQFESNQPLSELRLLVTSGRPYTWWDSSALPLKFYNFKITKISLQASIPVTDEAGKAQLLPRIQISHIENPVINSNSTNFELIKTYPKQASFTRNFGADRIYFSGSSTHVSNSPLSPIPWSSIFLMAYGSVIEDGGQFTTDPEGLPQGMKKTINVTKFYLSTKNLNQKYQNAIDSGKITAEEISKEEFKLLACTTTKDLYRTTWTSGTNSTATGNIFNVEKDSDSYPIKVAFPQYLFDKAGHIKNIQYVLTNLSWVETFGKYRPDYYLYCPTIYESSDSDKIYKEYTAGDIISNCQYGSTIVGPTYKMVNGNYQLQNDASTVALFRTENARYILPTAQLATYPHIRSCSANFNAKWARSEGIWPWPEPVKEEESSSTSTETNNINDNSSLLNKGEKEDTSSVDNLTQEDTSLPDKKDSLMDELNNIITEQEEE